MLRTLASLKLAVIVLVLLLIGLAAGTVLESRQGSETAGALVYYSWWFLLLQGSSRRTSSPRSRRTSPGARSARAF